MHRPLRTMGIALAGLLAPVFLLAQVPKGATAKCKDGTYSTSASKQGMCSSHGGVAQLVATRKPAATHAATKSANTASRTSRTTAPSRTTASRSPSRAASSSPQRRNSATSRTTAPAAAKPAAATQEVPTVAAPAGAPAGATAVCKDGTYSTSKVHTGACSHHGGVKDWLQQ